MRPIELTTGQLRRQLPDGSPVVVKSASGRPELEGRQVTVSVRAGNIRLYNADTRMLTIEFALDAAATLTVSPAGGLYTIVTEGWSLELQAMAGEGLPAELQVLVDHDQVVAGAGHGPDTEYSWRLWLPRLGPTAFLVARRLYWMAPDGGVLEPARVAEEMGVSPDLSPRSVMTRSVGRCVSMGLARWKGPDLVIYEWMPPLSYGAISKLPASVQAWAKDPAT